MGSVVLSRYLATTMIQASLTNSELDGVAPDQVSPRLHALRLIGDQRNQQQAAGHKIEQRRAPPDELIGKIGDDADDDRRYQEEDGLTQTVIGGHDIVQQGVFFRGRGGKRSDGNGQHTEGRQSEDQQHQRQVEMGPGAPGLVDHHEGKITSFPTGFFHIGVEKAGQ